MNLDINHFTPRQLDEAAHFFGEHGYLPLSGLAESLTGAFEESLAEAIGVTTEQLRPLLDPRAQAEIFPQRVRQRISRIATSPRLAQALLSSLPEIVATLVGPIVHVSSTFHGQFKGGTVVDIESYHNESAADYMEVHGAYRLHQDFTGASLPTSPSGLTLWIALNSCEESTLRLFPESHRLGMFCHRMWKLDDGRLERLKPAVDIEAQVGRGVLFNALLLHGTGKPGALRRVSCDIRFFPLCGFLPSEAHIVDARIGDRLRRNRSLERGSTLRTASLEQQVYLGEPVAVEPPPPLSSLNWVNYVSELMRGDADAALPHLTRFINPDLLEDPPSVFTQKFHNRRLHLDRLDAIRERVSAIPIDESTTDAAQRVGSEPDGGEGSGSVGPSH